MTRELLPERRASFNFTVAIQGEKYHVTVGYYPDGRPGEVFVDRIYTKSSAKVGTLLDSLCRDAAILVSMALQYGAPPDVMAHAISRDEEGTPQTIVGEIVDHIIKSGYFTHDIDKERTTTDEAGS